MTAYGLAYAALLLLSGRIGTIFGSRRMMVVGVGIFILASALGALAPNAAFLISARVLQGIGAALASPAVLVLLMSNTTEGPSRMRAMSWFIIASSASSAVGLILGGVLTSAFGWRAVMWVNVPLGLVILLAAPLVVTETTRLQGRIDAIGAALSAVAMGGLVYGFTSAAGQGWLAVQTLTAFVLAIIALIAFVYRQARSPEPIVPLRLLANMRLVTPYLGMLIMPASLMGLFYFQTLLFQDAMGLDALQTAFSITPFVIAIFIGGALTPRIITALGERNTVLIGILIAIAGMVAFGLFAERDFWLGAILPSTITGFGPPLFFATLNNRILGAAAPEDTGAASALLQSMQQLGGALGIAALTTIYAALLTTTPAGWATSVTVLSSAGFAVLVLIIIAIWVPRNAGLPAGAAPAE